MTIKLDQQIIKNIPSPWSAPVWVVHKKPGSNGIHKWRLVIDFRKLNEKTISDKGNKSVVIDEEL